MKSNLENKIWESALPYLEKGSMKDFVVHTKGVIKAMEIILPNTPGNRDLLIPAAILHDVGWAKVTEKLQKSLNKTDRRKALKLHLEYGASIAGDVLNELGFSNKEIDKIKDIIKAHKFTNPTDINKRLLIDADGLSDIFKEQFYSDCESYNCDNPKDLLEFRKNNEFYTKKAEEIFQNEFEKRSVEISES